ncbi:hypothetical protein TRVL_08076 [Trypanosoma vivax]|nr:hypothetical protein TRVL_08076 [Trypanosoma vivax]
MTDPQGGGTGSWHCCDAALLRSRLLWFSDSERRLRTQEKVIVFGFVLVFFLPLTRCMDAQRRGGEQRQEPMARTVVTESKERNADKERESLSKKTDSGKLTASWTRGGTACPLLSERKG